MNDFFFFFLARKGVGLELEHDIFAWLLINPETKVKGFLSGQLVRSFRMPWI